MQENNTNTTLSHLYRQTDRQTNHKLEHFASLSIGFLFFFVFAYFSTVFHWERCASSCFFFFDDDDTNYLIAKYLLFFLLFYYIYTWEAFRFFPAINGEKGYRTGFVVFLLHLDLEIRQKFSLFLVFLLFAVLEIHRL